MKLLQVPTIELEQRIKEEMEANPALDEGADEEDEDIKEDTEWEEETKEKEEPDDFDFSDYMQDDDIPAYKTSISNKSADDDEKINAICSGSFIPRKHREQLGFERYFGSRREIWLRRLLEI